MRIHILIALSFASISICSCKKDTARGPINCDGLITDTLGTNDSGRIYMPTAFSPNNDGLNDIIQPIFINILSFEFTIYDQQNNVVFNKVGTPNTGATNAWSSSIQPNETVKYYYKVQATTSSNHKIGMCGDLYKVNCIPRDQLASSLFFSDQLRANGLTGTTSEERCP